MFAATPARIWRRSQWGRKRFTLIELLICITIIALLAAMLLPALSRAKENARNVVRLAQVKQIGAAFLMNEEDNDKLIAAWQPWTPSHKGYVWWVTSLSEYFPEELAMCPSTVVKPAPRMGTIKGGQWNYSWWDGSQAAELNNKPEVASYGHNMFVSNFDEGPNLWSWRARYDRKKHYLRTKDITETDLTPLFADCLWTGGWPHGRNYEPPQALQRMQTDGPGSWDSGMSRFAITRHFRRKLNFVAADGHAETIRPSTLWELRWHREYQPREVVIPWEHADPQE